MILFRLTFLTFSGTLSSIMPITSAQFVKGLKGTDTLLENGIPQIAFIGRSNVGKSSVINTLTGQKDLAKTSAFPGRTQQINLFLINHSIYLVDLPGYGYAKIAGTKREQIEGMLNWYFFESPCIQRMIVLIIDADVGLTSIDKEMLFALEQHDKPVVILANKIDKIKKTEYEKQLSTIQARVGNHRVIPFSALEKTGIGELSDVVLGA